MEMGHCDADDVSAVAIAAPFAPSSRRTPGFMLSVWQSGALRCLYAGGADHPAFDEGVAETLLDGARAAPCTPGGIRQEIAGQFPSSYRASFWPNLLC